MTYVPAAYTHLSPADVVQAKDDGSAIACIRPLGGGDRYTYSATPPRRVELLNVYGEALATLTLMTDGTYGLVCTRGTDDDGTQRYAVFSYGALYRLHDLAWLHADWQPGDNATQLPVDPVWTAAGNWSGKVTAA